MSTSAFINFLNSLRPGETGLRPLLGEPNAKLTLIPQNVRDEVIISKKPLRLQGEVVQARADGTVRVLTPRGEIEFRPADGQRVPAQGQQIEIEIPSNLDKKQAPEALAYRRLNTQTLSATDTRSSTTPVDVRLGEESLQAPRTAPRSAPPLTISPAQALPLEGAIIRLQALAPQVKNTLTPYVPAEDIFTNPNAGALNATIKNIVQNIQSDFLNSLLTIRSQNSIPTLTSNFLNLTNQNIAPQNAQNLDQRLTAQNINSTVLTLTPQMLQKIAFSGISPALNVTPETPGTPAQPQQKIQSLNVAISELKTADIKLQTPNALISTQPQNIILGNQKAGHLIGTVTNFTSGQLPVLSVVFPGTQTLQFFVLHFASASIAVGTQIEFIPQNLSTSANAAATGQALHALPLALQIAPSAPWQVIDEVYQTLTQSHPLAAQAFSNIVPSPGAPAQMSPAMLFFIAAVRGGDLSQWLGDKTIDALRSTGKNNLLSRLSQEGSNLSRLGAETLPQEWRAMNLPMLYQGEIQKTTLFYRHEYNDNENTADGKNLKTTRFIFDLTLDVMGKVQVDGLFHPVSDAGKRLDLVVRTEQFFSQASQGEMRRLYARALRDTGVTGELSFQNKLESWVMVSGEKGEVMSV